MTTLLDRAYSLQVDTTRFEGLQIAFSVEHSLTPDPNHSEIRVWNLNRTNRKKLQEMTDVFVHLEAGYVDGKSLVFLGDLREATSGRDGTNWITTISAGDGGKAATEAQINLKLGAGSTVQQALHALVTALGDYGIGFGNFYELSPLLTLRGSKSNKFAKGCVLSGSVSSELDRIAGSADLEWSIQDRQLQFLKVGEPRNEIAVVLAAGTGLIGSPEPATKGLMKVRCLMIPDIYPGRRVVLKSEHVNGQFRAERTKRIGDLSGNDWFVDIELKEIEGV